jgi:DNA polymerase III gamma/tau subunit
MPVAGRYRVYIIDEVHMLSVNAFNALLKTLEEPPEHIVFIMATTEPHKLPVTVLSRCQKFEFTRYTASLIAQYLKKVTDELDVKADEKALFAIARAASGGMRDALSLLDQMVAMGEKVIDTRLVAETLGSADKLLYFALCEAILNQDISRALGGLSSMIEKGCSASTIASDLMQMFRDLYIVQNSSAKLQEGLSLDEASLERFNLLARKVSAGSVLKCLEIFSTLENDLRYAARPEIWLELAIGKACRVQKEQSFEALLERIETLEKKIASGNYKKGATEQAPIYENEPEQDEFFPVKDEDFAGSGEDEVFYQSVPVQEEYIQEEERVEVPDSNMPDDVEKAVPIKEPEVQEKKQENEEEPQQSQDTDEGRNIWNEAVELVREQKKMRLFMAMKKAKVTGFDGKTITICFNESDESSAKRLEGGELKDLLNKALKEVAKRNIIFSVIIERFSEEDNKFMKQVYDVFPDDIVSIE